MSSVRHPDGLALILPINRINRSRNSSARWTAGGRFSFSPPSRSTVHIGYWTNCDPEDIGQFAHTAPESRTRKWDTVFFLILHGPSLRVRDHNIRWSRYEVGQPIRVNSAVSMNTPIGVVWVIKPSNTECCTPRSKLCDLYVVSVRSVFWPIWPP